MDSDIVVSHNALIVPQTDDKQIRTRLNKYLRWLDASKHHFLDVDMQGYRDYLLQSMKPASVAVYLAAVRNRYKELITDRDLLFNYVPQNLSFAERKAQVDEVVTRIENAISPQKAPVKITTIQDRPDNAYLRLTSDQIEEFMSGPDLSTLKGVRDIAMIALMLATGCRSGEMAHATVSDLRVWFGNEQSFYIRHGKGRKERLVPYGELAWLLEYVDYWLSLSGITEGYIFRRVYKNGKKVGKKHLSGYGVELILASYPVTIDGELTPVKPHDLRRTYARRAYVAGMTVYQIQKNMGHKSDTTTKNYIGDLSAQERRPPAIYGSIKNRLTAIHTEKE